MHTVILPFATYGLSLFIKEPDFLKSVIGYFWKRWARISKYTSTTRLLEHLFNHDFLDVHKAKEARRAIAWYYSTGLHHKICKSINCYRTESICECRICDKKADTYGETA